MTELTPEQKFELEKSEQNHRHKREYWSDVYILLRILTYVGTCATVGVQVTAYVLNAVGGVP